MREDGEERGRKEKKEILGGQITSATQQVWTRYYAQRKTLPTRKYGLQLGLLGTPVFVLGVRCVYCPSLSFLIRAGLENRGSSCCSRTYGFDLAMLESETAETEQLIWSSSPRTAGSPAAAEQTD